MLEADDLTAAVKRAESELSAETKKVDADRKAMAAEFAELRSSLEKIGSERTSVIKSLSAAVLSIFERVAQRRNGIAVAEARDGICTICHVRLRPQVFNTVRRNEQIVQCDSCNRILYFVPAAAAPTADSVSQPAR
jgi:predicted  nucleic acid-binding Zn-ribbon protein